MGKGEGEGKGKGKGYFKDYPKCVFFILGNEFCERFSYYGMKAILTLFLTRALGYASNEATAIYHGFNFACYFMPIFGAMIADGWIGKYKTILYISMIYCVGNVVMAITAIPFNGAYSRWAPFIGLVLIAVGTGGIKPCVSAFGGDQFEDEQQRQKDSFFSVFYMAINTGSLISMILTPILRSQVFCFNDNCWSLAFGIPAALMVVAVIFFIVGTKWYKIIPPGESTIGKLFGCVKTAIAGKCCCKKKDLGEREHWLDYADVNPRYDKKFIEDVKAVMGVLFMFLPLPIFWALFDQQGSTWTLQAGKMNGDFGNGVVIQPDMIQVFNPLIVIILVPLLESLVFPCLDKIGIPNRPLQRLGFGMCLAGTAFIVTAILQMQIEAQATKAIVSGNTKFNFINAAPCDVTITSNATGLTDFPMFIKYGEGSGSKEYSHQVINDAHFNVTYQNCNLTGSTTFTATPSLEKDKAYTVIAGFINDTRQGYQLLFFNQDKTLQTGNGKSTIRVFNMLPSEIDMQLNTGKLNSPLYIYNITRYNHSAQVELIHADFTIKLRPTYNLSYPNTQASYPWQDIETTTQQISSKNGAVNTMVVTVDNNNRVAWFTVEDVAANTVNILWQIPQYFVMSLGEVFFSVTGLSFAYSQSPLAMKSVLQAAWLLTNAFGNVLVMIISLIGSMPSATFEFFMFSGLMYLTVIVFAIMSCFYVYVEDRPQAEEEEKEKPPPPEVYENAALDTSDEKAVESAKTDANQNNVTEAPPPYTAPDTAEQIISQQTENTSL